MESTPGFVKKVLLPIAMLVWHTGSGAEPLQCPLRPWTARRDRVKLPADEECSVTSEKDSDRRKEAARVFKFLANRIAEEGHEAEDEDDG